ncbi:MAG: hypothetical protein IKQ55_07130 [Kiritimatiellae bacterium]|nr:hypothetical protein [Kiritimatiellia bacterium]
MADEKTAGNHPVFEAASNAPKKQKFSNDWKKSFQWLENFFPMVGKNGKIFQ